MQDEKDSDGIGGTLYAGRAGKGQAGVRAGTQCGLTVESRGPKRADEERWWEPGQGG